MKQAVIALLVIGAAAVLAHLHVVSQTYHPSVRIASPDGLTYIAVQSATAERRACGEANERFLGPLKVQCKECRIVSARCERAIEGEVELALDEGKPLAYYSIVAPGVRMAITGPQDMAKLSCELIVGDMVKRGLRSAACVVPRAANQS
jgi:hypothetical protein